MRKGMKGAGKGKHREKTMKKAAQPYSDRDSMSVMKGSKAREKRLAGKAM